MAQALHRYRQLRHYRVELADGDRAYFDCFWFDEPDDLECRISHLVVSPDQWWQSGKVLVPTGRIQDLDDDDQIIKVCMTREEVTHGGPFESAVHALRERPAYNAADVVGCDVITRDGESGKVVDILVDVNHWDLRYLELDTGPKEVLVDPAWTNGIDVENNLIRLDLPADAIDGAPEFRTSTIINSGYCEALYRHYTSRQFLH
jgi:sporulation protein YlmC with PRC-barrel domain